MVEIAFTSAIALAVITFLVGTWLKNSGGIFRLMFAGIIFLGVGVPFVATYGMTNPVIAGAGVVGFIVGILT